MKADEKMIDLAVKNLLPRDVLLVRSDVVLRSDFKPLEDTVRYYTTTNCDQYVHELSPEGINLYTFICTIGIGSSNSDESIEDEGFEFDVRLMATFEVLYQSDVELQEESLAAFGDQHVGYHVWPFWREFVFSSCRRAGIRESIPIPLFSIHKMPNRARESA